MTTDRQIEANRRNARNSTGPKTPEGKAASSRNALKHGLLSREVVLWNEDSEEFKEFRRLMIEALDPQDQVEALLADRVVANAWRLRRVYRIEREMMMDLLRRDSARTVKNFSDTIGGEYLESPVLLGPNMVEDFQNYRNFDCLHRYESPIDRAFYKALHELERRQARRRGEPVPPPINVELAVTSPSRPPLQGVE